jgi:hypothetical protein
MTWAWRGGNNERRGTMSFISNSGLESNSNLIQISMKENAFYSQYKSRAIDQYKNNCIAA